MKYIILCCALKIRGPRGILCTRGEKEYASKRQTIVVHGDCLVKKEVCDAGTTGLANSEAEMLAFQSERAV